jgi:hypothetical protein
VVCPALQYFSTLPHKRHDMRKIYWTKNVCSDFLCSFCLKHFPFYELNEIVWEIYVHFHVKYPLFLSNIFNKTWVFSKDFQIILKYKISWTSVQCDLSCFMRRYGRADRQADMTKQIAAFRNSANAPANEMSKETHRPYTKNTLK